MKLFKSSILHQMLLRFPSEMVLIDRFVEREPKTRLQCLASAMLKFVMPSAARKAQIF